MSVPRALAAFSPGQVKTSGEDAEVSPRHALALSLALHELATNATKYGALSCPEGTVSVGWRVEHGRLHLDWQESGGPPVRPPGLKGFGTRLLEELAASDLGGTSHLAFDGTGVRGRISAELLSKRPMVAPGRRPADEGGVVATLPPAAGAHPQ
jgi:two-component sensor histidine kinase